MTIDEFKALTPYQRAKALESVPRWRVLITSYALDIHNASSMTDMSKMFTDIDVFALNPVNILGIQSVDISKDEEYATLHFTLACFDAVYSCYLILKLDKIFPSFKLGDFYKEFNSYKEKLDKYVRNMIGIESDFKLATCINMRCVDFAPEWDSIPLTQLKATEPEKLGKCLMDSFSDWRTFLLSRIDDMRDIVSKDPIIPNLSKLRSASELLECDLSPLSFSTDDFKSIDRVDFLGNGEVSIIFTLNSKTNLIMVLKENDVYPRLKYGDSGRKLRVIDELRKYLKSVETITSNLK